MATLPSPCFARNSEISDEGDGSANAGLPNPLSPTGFDLEPADMARYLRDFANGGLLNIAGGCCGNTPEHIAALAEEAAKHAPRQITVIA